MITVRISEAELAGNVRAVLEKIRMGTEVIIEHEDHSPMAVMRKAQPAGRSISECIRLAEAHEASIGYSPVPDPAFAGDVAASVAALREPLEPPSWNESSTRAF